MDPPVYGPVLLVCIYNKYGNILTHDYFYQIFSQYGEIVKILIFQKAKVWKTFIQFTQTPSAKNAMNNLNNKVVFDDGSKMNIFSSKLKHIKFQNSNLGGVNYEDLKNEQLYIQSGNQMTRGRRSTLQQNPTPSFIEPYTYNYNYSTQSIHGTNKSLTGEKQSTFSFVDPSDSFSGHKSQKSSTTFDIDGQFLQLACESQQFLQMKKQEELNRRKSKTIVTNPNVQQFVLQNSPSKVLYIRSIPLNYTNQCLYNIFSCFGLVIRVIFMKQKSSGLIQFQDLQQAILAKDELNYIKPTIKIFYSHYETLKLKEKDAKDEEDYVQYAMSSPYKGSVDRRKNNPPSEILFLTHTNPAQQEILKEKFEQIECPIKNIDWKKSEKDKWMCLVELGHIDQSLKVIGFLQGLRINKGKQIKISFTRSKIEKNALKKYHHDDKSSI